MKFSDYVDEFASALGIDGITVIHSLGYILAVVITGGIVKLGLTFISNDVQLVMVMIGTMVVLFTMAVSCVYMRSQRFTLSEQRKRCGSSFYERIPKKEQTLFQLSIVLTIAMIALGIVIKWPLITSVVKELFGFNG